MNEWIDEEHDILIKLTADQLALEAKNESKVITWQSWHEHWGKVSAELYRSS
jgi:hypothetical protein